MAPNVEYQPDHAVAAQHPVAQTIDTPRGTNHFVLIVLNACLCSQATARFVFRLVGTNITGCGHAAHRF